MEFKLYLISAVLVFFNSLSNGKPSSTTTTAVVSSLEPCRIYSLPPYYRENCTKDGGVYTTTYTMGLCGNNEACECPYYTCLNQSPKTTTTTTTTTTTKITPKITPTVTSSLEPCRIYSLPPYYRENCTKDGGVYTTTYTMGLCGNNEACECPYYTCLNQSPKTTTTTTTTTTTKITPKITPTVTSSLEPCRIYSLPPYYRENCTKDGGVYTTTYTMGLCGNNEACECPYYTCLNQSPKTTTTTTTTTTTKITPKITPTVTSSLEPCRIYSLPPYYRENCTKDGGVYTTTYTMGLCGNNEACECPYYTCLNQSPKTTTTTTTTTTTKITPTVTSSLEPCRIYSLPPYYRENCTKDGGVYTTTYTMGLCGNNEACECPYYTCLNQSPKTTTTTTKIKTSTLQSCKTYTMPPHYRENCTKDGGIYTKTYSLGLCNKTKTCNCSYYTCLRNTKTENCEKVTVTIKDKTTVTIKETIKETVTVTKTVQPHASNTNDATTKCVKKWGQCGGVGFNGSSCCESGLNLSKN